LTSIENNNNTTKEYKVNFNEHAKEEDFEIEINHLNHHQKSKINKLIHKYKSVQKINTMSER